MKHGMTKRILSAALAAAILIGGASGGVSLVDATSDINIQSDDSIQITDDGIDIGGSSDNQSGSGSDISISDKTETGIDVEAGTGTDIDIEGKTETSSGKPDIDVKPKEDAGITVDKKDAESDQRL